MKDICNKLLETYDSRYLDRLDLKSQRVWNDITRKILNSKNPYIKNNSNIVLSRLVQNHFNKNKPITDLLSGPMSFSLHKSDKYNMNIYIFGEFHGLKDDCKKFIKKDNECKKPCTEKQICNPKTGRCVLKTGKIGKNIKVNNKNNITETEIQEYFKNLVNNTNVFLDLYFEFPQFLGNKYKDYYNIKNILNPEYYMNKIFKNFIECVQTETRVNNKNCELFRVHYIDIRKKGEDYFDSILYKLRKTLDVDGNVKQNLKLLETFKNISKEELLNMYKKDVENNKYIQKELSKTLLKDEILTFCHDMLRDEIINDNLIKDLRYYSKYILNIYPKINEDIITSFTNNLVFITANMVDVYTLSRIFREEFKNTKYQPKKQYNIIIQAGDCHSKLYRSFLKKLNFKMIENAGLETNVCYKDNFGGTRKSPRCLDMKNISQPFFE